MNLVIAKRSVIKKMIIGCGVLSLLIPALWPLIHAGVGKAKVGTTQTPFSQTTSKPTGRKQPWPPCYFFILVVNGKRNERLRRLAIRSVKGITQKRSKKF